MGGNLGNIVPGGQRKESIAVRLGDLGLSRATEQTALLLAMLTANGGKHNRQYGDRFALASMLGYLSHAHCVGRIVHPDPIHASDTFAPSWSALYASSEHQGPAADKLFGCAPTSTPDAPRRWDLDLVIGPVDGMRALTLGHSNGSIAVLGGGDRDAFDLKDGDLALDYLVFVVPRPLVGSLDDVCARLCGGVFRDVDGLIMPRPGQFGLDEVYRPALGILAGAIPANIPSTWATAINPPDYADSYIREELLRRFKTYAFGGSSIAAGLAALLPQSHIAGFVGIVRRTHVFLLAIAAHATGGALLAVPIRDRGIPRVQTFEPHTERRVLRETDLIKTDSTSTDAFLVVTAITDTHALPGIELHDDATATTHTLCLRSKTRACRTIRHVHDLRRKPFRLLNRESKEWRELRPVLERFAGEGVDSRVRFSS